MCLYAKYIGFLDEKELPEVDDDFQEVSRQINMIPGIGTHGVTCAGHFEPKYDGYPPDSFWPRPFAHLGFAALPEVLHVREILYLIDAHAQTDPNAYFYTYENTGYVHPKDRKRFEPGFDFRPFAVESTHDGLSVVKLELRLGSNDSLRDVFGNNGHGDDYCNPLKLKGNQEIFEKTKARCEVIKAFWKALEGKVKAFNEEYGFDIVNFQKKEFLPFV